MKLKEYLDHKRIEYKEFAEMVGISYGTIWNIFHRGNRNLAIAIKIEDLTRGAVTCRDTLTKEIEKKGTPGPHKRLSLDKKPDDGVKKAEKAASTEAKEQATG
jgi:hypothetical protein